MARRGPPKGMKTLQPVWGQGFALPLGFRPARSFTSAPAVTGTASSTESPWPCGPPKWMKTLGAGKHETGSAGDLVAGVLQGSVATVICDEPYGKAYMRLRCARAAPPAPGEDVQELCPRRRTREGGSSRSLHTRRHLIIGQQFRAIKHLRSNCDQKTITAIVPPDLQRLVHQPFSVTSQTPIFDE